MKKILLTTLLLLAFALPAFAVDAVFMPKETKLELVIATHVATDNYLMVAYDTDGTCSATSHVTYTATGLTGDASYDLGAPTFANVGTAAQVTQVATLGADDTHTFTSTAAIVDADCFVTYVDENDNGTVETGDDAVHVYKYDNATGKAVGAGLTFTLTLTDGYLFGFD